MFQPSLPPKRQGEAIFVTFNFFDQMVFGETIGTPVVVVEEFSGIDHDPSLMLSGVPSISGSILTQKIQGGMAGVSYAITATAVGSSGNTYAVVQNLSVISITGFAASSTPSLTGTLPDGMVGVPYSANLQISGGYAPYQPVGLISGAPAWMGFTVVDDELICHGLPDEPAVTNYVFSPQILDAALTSASSPQNIDIFRVFITGDAPDGFVGSSYSYTYTFGSGTPPYSFAVISGSTPTGTAMNPATSEIAGTTTTVQTATWTAEITDANGVKATIPDSADIELLTFFLAIGTQMRVFRSNDGGASFTELINYGIYGTSSNFSVSTAGDKVFLLGNTAANARYSTVGNTGTFSVLTGTLPFVPGSGVVQKIGAEYQMYSGGSTVGFSADGIAWNTRTHAGLNRLITPAVDSFGTVIATSSNLVPFYNYVARSTDFGVTFSAPYAIPEFQINTQSNITFFTDSAFLLFGKSAAAGNVQLLGISATGLSGSWVFGPAPEQSPGTDAATCCLITKKPGGKTVIILQNGHMYSTNNHGTSWTPEINIPPSAIVGSGGTTNNRMTSTFFYAAGYFYVVLSDTVTLPKIYRIPEDLSAWEMVHQVVNFGAGTSTCTIAPFNP